MTVEYRVLDNPDAVAESTADQVVAAGEAAIERSGRFVMAMSGGTTPLLVCPLLVVPPRVNRLDWRKVHIFFADERAVPATHADSNYNTAKTALLDYLPRFRTDQVHRMIGEAADLNAAARAYEAQIGRTLGVEPPGPPVFDLMWLGMGDDGHTASLFPGTDALAETERWTVPNWIPRLDAWRLTLTFPVLNAARLAMFVATGPGKRDAMAAVRSGTSDLPAARVNAQRTLWIVDADCAGGPPAR